VSIRLVTSKSVQENWLTSFSATDLDVKGRARSAESENTAGLT
jgi:hypothetical protein